MSAPVGPVPAGCLLAAGAMLLAAAAAQDPPRPRGDDPAGRPDAIDPYTAGDGEAMARAGVVSYAPFPWADGHRTEDVERVLGEGRVLWLETAHFKLGSALRSADWPERAVERRQLQEEIRQLRARLPKLPERPRRLDSWLRLHLYAQRCERAYVEFEDLVGVTAADFPARGGLPREGPYLGLPGKFLVLLFQKRSDMARYMDRFTATPSDASMRIYHDRSHQMLFCVATESMEGIDEPALHGHVLHAVWHNLMNGYNGYSYPLPHWFTEGLAHWHARRVETDFLNVQIREDDAVAEDKQSNWPVKVRRRAQHERACIPFATMLQWRDWEELGYQAHAQSWSRIDYLMHLDRKKVGAMLRRLKALPPTGNWDEQGAAARALCGELVAELFGFDGPTFDRKWREWVLKTYPKK